MSESPSSPGSSRSAPVPWLLWALAFLVVSYTTRNPLYLVLLGAVLWATAEAHAQRLSRRLFFTMTGLGLLWNFLTVHVGSTVLFALPGTWFLIGGPYTLESALYGALNGLALALILSAFGLLMSRLSPRDLVRLTPPALYEAGLVLSVALAFLPQGRETLEEIRQAQAVRGHRVKGLRDLLPLLLPLLITALERGEAPNVMKTLEGAVACLQARDVLVPVSDPDVPERRSDELPHRVCCPGRDDVVARGSVADRADHGVDVVRCPAPVSGSVQVAERQGARPGGRDGGHRGRDLASHKGGGSPR